MSFGTEFFGVPRLIRANRGRWASPRCCIISTWHVAVGLHTSTRFVESLRFVRSYKTELPELSKLLPTIETPVLIITGDHDPGVLPVHGDYLHEQLPHNKADKVNAGHFAWADAADEYAILIIEWWEGGYERSSCSKHWGVSHN